MASTKRVLESSESESETEGDVYEIERILAQDDVGGEVLYLVKWKGYRDRECTWEPASNFQDSTTILEWKRQLAKGDYLNEDQVAEVQQRMDDYQADQEEEERRKQAEFEKRESKRRKIDASTPISTKAASPAKATTSSRAAVKQQPVQAKIFLLSPEKFTPHYALEPATSSLSTVRPILKDSSTVQAGALQLVKRRDPSSAKAGPQQSTKRRRSSISDGKFRSLSHMNNARKKAARVHIAPEMTNLIAPSELVRREPAHTLPPSAIIPKDDSPLFFTESRSASAEPTPKPLVTLPPSVTKQLSPAISDVKVNEVASHKPIMKKRGRKWSKEEILVQLRLGDNAIGDVKLSGLPAWLRWKLIALKIDGDLSLDFAQDFVYNRQQFSDMAAEWPPAEGSYGEVQPFDDTAAACESLAAYFEQHDVAAVWPYPNPETSNSCLVLLTSSLPRWRQANNIPLAGAMPRLLLGVRNRAWKGKIPPPLLPPDAFLPSTANATSPDLAVHQKTFSPPSPPPLPPPLPPSLRPPPPATPFDEVEPEAVQTMTPQISAVPEAQDERTAPSLDDEYSGPLSSRDSS